MRPDIVVQQVAQFNARAKSDLALPDPIEDAVAPPPMLHEAQVLIDEIDGKIHLAAVHFRFGGKRIAWHIRKHVLGIDDVTRHVHDAIQAFYVWSPVNEK